MLSPADRTSDARRPVTAKRTTALLLVAAMVLSACASSTRRPSNPSSEQSALYDYAESYTTQGVAIGAVAGAILGCTIGALASKNKGRGCAIGAAAGGAGGALLGGAGGYLAAENQRQYATQEDRLYGLSRAADVELSKARNARTDAERIVANHRTKIASLEEGYKARKVSEETMERALQEARYDRDQIERASENVESQIEVMNDGITQAANSGSPNTQRLVSQRNALLAERNKLNQQLISLDIEIDKAESLLS